MSKFKKRYELGNVILFFDLGGKVSCCYEGKGEGRISLNLNIDNIDLTKKYRLVLERVK